MAKPKQKPEALFLVHCEIGFPDRGNLERRGHSEEHMRVFKRADSAGWFIRSLRKWPKLHRFLGVYHARVEWQEIDEAQLPQKMGYVAEGDEDV